MIILNVVIFYLAIKYDAGFMKAEEDSLYSGHIYYRGFICCTVAHIFSSLVLNWIVMVFYWIIVIIIAGAIGFSVSLSWSAWLPLFLLCGFIIPFIEKIKQGHFREVFKNFLEK